MDGSHIFQNVFVDLYYLQTIVRPGGLIIVDNYWWPRVATAARYFETNLGWRSNAVASGTPGRLRETAIAGSAGPAGIQGSHAILAWTMTTGKLFDRLTDAFLECLL